MTAPSSARGACRSDAEDGCITCGDVAVELTVELVDVDRDLALCSDAAGRQESVEIALVGPVRTGDRLQPAFVVHQPAHQRQRRLDPEFVAPLVFALAALDPAEQRRRQRQHAEQAHAGHVPVDRAIGDVQQEAELDRTQALVQQAVAAAQPRGHRMAAEIAPPGFSKAGQQRSRGVRFTSETCVKPGRSRSKAISPRKSPPPSMS